MGFDVLVIFSEALGVGLYIASHAWVIVGFLSVHHSLLLRNVYSLFSISVHGDEDKNWHNERTRVGGRMETKHSLSIE